VSRALTLILAAMLAILPARAVGDPAILEIRVLEGDSTVYSTGSRATRGVTVLVTDETGRPVDGATVSFSLPADGPGGVFASGSRTEIATTRADGRASVWGMQWNRTAGPFEIRITAIKGQARAGTVSSQYLSDAPAAAQLAPGKIRTGWGSHKILWISLAIAGAAVAGVAASSGGKTAAASSAATSAVQIGTPTISLGRP
jgi:hypothetical protein